VVIDDQAIKTVGSLPGVGAWSTFTTWGIGFSRVIWVAGAAKQLGLHESLLYAWRKEAWYEQSRSETKKELGIEDAHLRAVAYFPKSLK
jgi:hypothetical protein